MKESIEFDDTVNKIIPIIINFNSEKITLLLDIDNRFPNMEAKRVQAKELNLSSKSELHLTIVGTNTGKKIRKDIDLLDRVKRENILNKIYTLAESIKWNISLQNKFFYIEKEYAEEDLNDEGSLIYEKRKSIIQMAEINGLKFFYRQLNVLLGEGFDEPLPHITLYTTSTREDKRLRGIGIYSQKQLEEMNPQQI